MVILAADDGAYCHLDATSGAEIAPPPHPIGLADEVKRLFR